MNKPCPHYIKKTALCDFYSQPCDKYSKQYKKCAVYNEFKDRKKK